MVCEPSKMPINLETNNKEHNTFTTSLITNYENSSCIVKNKGSHLQVLYDTFSKPQVSFTDDSGERQEYILDPDLTPRVAACSSDKLRILQITTV